MPTPSPSPPPSVETGGSRLAAGYQNTCIVIDGGVRCWGNGPEGQTTAEVVQGLSDGVVAITMGSFHGCALTRAGGVKCWGSNWAGQLGNGTTSDSLEATEVLGLTSGVAAISASAAMTCALTAIGGVHCWGNNAFGGLGNGTRTDSRVPVPVIGLDSGVLAISVGGLHACALTDAGGALCWGEGQSADPREAFVDRPTAVPGLEDGIAAIAASLGQVCALRASGELICGGHSYTLAPGADLGGRFVPVDLSALSGPVTSVVVGETHACVLTDQGRAGCWGIDAWRQLGRGGTVDTTRPADVERLESDVVEVAVGGQHTCALSRDGAVRCWGSNAYGQLGIATRCVTTAVPVAVPLDGSVVPAPSTEPTWLPVGPIAHATGPTDVVLRMDVMPDLDVGDLVGELFQPGPEFTLYGDGRVIFRDHLAAPPRIAKGILRGVPFRTAVLDESQVQALLRFALLDSGLADACELYVSGDVDITAAFVFTVRAGGLDKRIEGYHAERLVDHLRGFDRSVIGSTVWTPDRYWGSLFDASVFQFIGEGVTPGLAEHGSVAWPWPAFGPADFAGLDDQGRGRRIMSVSEAGELGLSAGGGVVQRVYVRAPTGSTLYYFSLWPMALDESAG